jgi:hypothetical protein
MHRHFILSQHCENASCRVTLILMNIELGVNSYTKPLVPTQTGGHGL